MNSGNILSLSRRSIVTVKAHVPLIKFRKGGHEGTTSAGSHNQNIVSGRSGPRPILEDYQLPLRYRRPPLDEVEINAINSGGIF